MASRSEVVHTTTVTSGATLTSATDLGQAWSAAWLCVQSMTSNSQLFLQASDSLAGTYRRVGFASIATSTVAVNEFSIPSSTTNAVIAIPQGLRYLKVEQTATANSGQIYKIIVSGG